MTDTEQGALLLRDMLSPEDAVRICERLYPAGGWRLADTLPRFGTVKDLFVAIASALAGDGGLRREYMRELLRDRPRRAADIDKAWSLLGGK